MKLAILSRRPRCYSTPRLRQAAAKRGHTVKVVLTLHRGTTVIPNRRSNRELEGGDRLLCFGKLASMRQLIRGQAQRDRRPRAAKLREPSPDSD